MGNHHPTCPFCHSSTVEGYRCCIFRAIFAGFIAGSSAATLESTRRCAHKSVRTLPPGLSCGQHIPLP